MAEYGASVESTASPERVWKIWSDMSTWGDWNPNVSTMDWTGGFVQGSEGTMNTKAGQHHCRVEPAGGKTKLSQMVEIKGLLGPIMQGMMGPQVSKEFPTLLANLARKPEAG